MPNAATRNRSAAACHGVKSLAGKGPGPHQFLPPGTRVAAASTRVASAASTGVAAAPDAYIAGRPPYTCDMDRLWTPWRYAYVTKAKLETRKGVPEALDGYPEDHDSVFLNLIGAVRWATGSGTKQAIAAEKAGHVLMQGTYHFAVLNAFPYNSGHLMLVPYEQTDSLAKLSVESATEMMSLAQRMETALRTVYRPEGINMGLNLGEAAGAGVAEHLHLHILPRWYGDTNFMTTVGETRMLPETLDITWQRLREALGLLVEDPESRDPESQKPEK